MTKRRLALFLGVSEMTVSNYEKAKVQISMETRTKAALIFGVSINVLLAGYDKVYVSESEREIC